MTNSNLIRAKDFFYNKEYEKALELFAGENESYPSGLCSLLLQNTDKAREYFNINKKNCPASQWGLCVLEMINLNQNVKPTFFQTRAFLEIYLNLFIENNLIEWAQNLVSSCDFLFEANPESYKFIARALYSNGYFEMAINFCKKSLRLFYSDPEAFLILSQCQFLLGDLAEALDSINRTLSLADNYYPAILFEKIIRAEIAKRKK